MSQVPVVVEGELTIYRVGEIRPMLQKALTEFRANGTIALDLGGVTECDGAGMQLLMAFGQAVSSIGGSLALWHVPDNVSAILNEYGIAKRFVMGAAGESMGGAA